MEVVMGGESVFLTVSTTEEEGGVRGNTRMLTTFYWITLEFVSVAKMQPKTSSSNLMSTQRDWFRFLNDNIFPFLTFLLFMTWKHATHSKHDLFYCFQL